MLPHVSGHAVLQEIAASAHTRNIPVVVVTGSPEPLDYLDVFCVLRKPIASDELITVVRRCLAHHSTSPR
jgi:CheY-like chemotaxis protein